jgi:hypothetical protein
MERLSTFSFKIKQRARSTHLNAHIAVPANREPRRTPVARQLLKTTGVIARAVPTGPQKTLLPIQRYTRYNRYTHSTDVKEGNKEGKGKAYSWCTCTCAVPTQAVQEINAGGRSGR